MVGIIVPVGENTCGVVNVVVECDGRITHRDPVYHSVGPCPVGAEHFRKYCDPASAFSASDGFCELVDYYGNRIRLRVTAPPHEFQARPYPVGFVAREDVFGVFHPTFRIRWIPPALGNPGGDFPTYADSGWRLWMWGGNRGPGNPQDHPFPCHFSEAELMHHHIPAGTICLRAQLWSAPDYDAALNPILLPGRLEYPTRNLQTLMPPGQVIELNFPYASHPNTRQTADVRFGRIGELPAFPGYFQRWWKVRFRVETKVVEDVPGTRRVCRPTSSRNVRDGCYVIENGQERPGEWVTETYVERKRWVEGETKDRVLNLRELGHPYDAMHPRRGIIYGPDMIFHTNLVLWNGTWWLWIPIAVREGQGVVCANPGCVGEEPALP
ncbi:MAG: hypothetical protein RMM10_08860 [Anaerolineae bacterium]|nr:hypothetical protein [Thermoflexus sp.]MDW8181072.1 hypothetical protein [Anaerolineae bacterium]